MTKPYYATSLKSAEREVRMLRKQRTESLALLERYAKERVVLAKLAALSPQFYNPLDVVFAEKLRDSILEKKA